MTKPTWSERRRHLRVSLPFPATVEGLNAQGINFKTSTSLHDLSAGGLYLHLKERVKENFELTITARLSTNPNRGSVLLFKGKVVRVEPKSSGLFGVAMKFKSRRFL